MALFLALAGALAVAVIAGVADGTTVVPSFYVLGDSTADVGNNNYLNLSSLFKANFPHYGIDFPGSQPTGRFSNGFLGVDYFAQYMGFSQSPPAYLFLINNQNNTSFASLINAVYHGRIGANFASGGSGVFDSTGPGTITLSEQIQYFAALKAQIQANVGASVAADLVADSLFLLSTGGNDVFAFFSKYGATPNDTTVNAFVASFTSNFSSHVQTLYALGARKFAVINVGVVGCCPISRLINSSGGCEAVLNSLAQRLNIELSGLFVQLSATLPGFRYSIGNAYQFVVDIIARPAIAGFTDVADGCCGAGKFNAEVQCNPNTTYCADRRQYVFWDSFHPTQKLGELVALAFYYGPNVYTCPINYFQLAIAP